MFSDTIVFPLLSGNITLVKVNQDGYSSEYRFTDSLKQLVLKIRHSKTKASATQVAKDRHNVEISRTIFATATVPELTQKTYVVLEHTPSDTSFELADALADWAIATANANLIKLIAWES